MHLDDVGAVDKSTQVFTAGFQRDNPGRTSQKRLFTSMLTVGRWVSSGQEL